MADQLITGTTLVEKESRSIGDAPIGAILAWAKSLSGVPNLAEGWVECDGSVLVDALSPLNGQTIPDLNGDNRFLRGNSTSGGTGGSATAAHEHDMAIASTATSRLIDAATTIGFVSGDSDTKVERYTSGGAVSVSTLKGKTQSTAPANLPPYYNIVWIMRVR